jgi:pimeloyl-ACP methyl ester carboxylesterase
MQWLLFYIVFVTITISNIYAVPADTIFMDNKTPEKITMEKTFFYNQSDYITYEKRGNGQTIVVCIHGIASARRSWDELLPYFDENKYTFYIIDLKGFGNSSMPKDKNYSLDAQAAIVANFINSTIDSDYLLMGHSMGGGVCLSMLVSGLLIRQPRSQILIDAASYKENVASFVWWMRSRFLNYLAFNLTPAKLRTKTSLKLVVYKANLTPQILDRYVQLGKNKKQSYSLARATQQLIPPRKKYELQISQYDSMQTPTLIIWGKNDPVISVKNGEKLHAQIAGSQLAIIDSCGHLTHEEKPQQVAKTIEKFVVEQMQ